jgi:hypothetical protein
MSASDMQFLQRTSGTPTESKVLTSYNAVRVQNVIKNEAVLVYAADALSMRIDAQWTSDFTLLLSLNNDACATR